MKNELKIEPLDFCSSAYGEEDCINYNWRTDTIESDKNCRDCLHKKIKEITKTLKKLRKIRDFEKIEEMYKKS